MIRPARQKIQRNSIKTDGNSLLEPNGEACRKKYRLNPFTTRLKFVLDISIVKLPYKTPRRLRSALSAFLVIVKGVRKMRALKKKSIAILSAAIDDAEAAKSPSVALSVGELAQEYLSEPDERRRRRLIKKFVADSGNLNEFIAAHPELINSEVERALLEAAVGGEYVETETRLTANGRRSVKRTVKRAPPNPRAALAWLQNRSSERWVKNPQAEPELEDTSAIEEEIYGDKKNNPI